MDNFKKIIKKFDGLAWNNINLLCLEKGKNYFNEFVKFYFMCNTKKLETITIHFSIPESILPKIDVEYHIFLEDYFLRDLSSKIQKFNEDAHGFNVKSTYGIIVIQNYDQTISKRNSFFYNKIDKSLNFYFKIRFPLNNNKIFAKTTIQFVTKIISLVKESFKKIDSEDFFKRLDIYKKQLAIRKFLDDNEYVCFIANGSILPRLGSSDLKDINSIPFLSPKEYELSIKINNNTIIGMGIKKGITSIIGAAFSGKSTLLNAIEMGIYNHIFGDGREYCISNISTIKISSEDGKYINNMDLSLFVNNEAFDSRNFNTLCASGSISQASNLVEAILVNSKLILIEEDYSALNFLIKDHKMKEIVHDDSVVPFFDLLPQLVDLGISIIICSGAMSAFLDYSDQIIMINKFVCYKFDKNKISLIEVNRDKSEKIKKIKRYLNKKIDLKSLFFKEIKFLSDKLIKIDDYEVDIKRMTAITNAEKINTLVIAAIQVLGKPENYSKSLLENCEEVYSNFFNDNWSKVSLSNFYLYDMFYEEVRIIDIYFFVNRMRGLQFERN